MDSQLEPASNLEATADSDVCTKPALSKYYGVYARVEEPSSKESAHLASNESVIGAGVELYAFADEEGLDLIGVKSARGKELGHFDSNLSRTIKDYLDAGLTCTAYLSAVAYAEAVGTFWGEFAIICFPPEQNAIWERFCTLLSARIAKGEHPQLGLSAKEVAHVLQSEGSWCEMKTKPYDKLERGGVYFKKRRSASDSLVDMATSGKTGCKIGAIVFWVVVLVALAYGIWHWLA